MLTQEQRHPLHIEIASLRDELEEARETIRNLRDLLMPPNAFPLAWNLTAAESRMLAALYARPDGMTKEALHSALDDHMQPESQLKIVDVFMCKLRKKMSRHDVKFRTLWGRGYMLEPESRPIIDAALASANVVAKDLKTITRRWL